MVDAVLLAKRCPECGRMLPGDSIRCGYCLTDVRDIEADTPVPEAPSNPSRRALPLPVRRASRRVWALPKWLLLLAVLALVTGGWCGYGALKPERSLALPASAALSQPDASTMWPSNDGDGTHARRSAVTVNLASMRAAWSSELGVALDGPPVADATQLYLVTDDDRIVTLRISDGGVAWQFVQQSPLAAAPVIADGRLYVLTRGGDALALDAASGAEVWRTPLEGAHFYNSPAIKDGTLVALSATGALYGLDAADGTPLWDLHTGSEWGTLAPVVSDRSVIVATADTINVYDRGSGALTLQYPHGHAVGLGLLDDGAVVSVSSNFVERADPTATLPWWWGARGTWTQLWVWGLGPEPPRPGFEWVTLVRPARLPPNVPPPTVYAPTFTDGAVIVANQDGTVRALDAGDGAERWRIEAGAMAGAPVSTPSGVLLPLRDAVSLRATLDGSEVARLALTMATDRSVVVTSAATFVVDGEGRVTAFR